MTVQTLEQARASFAQDIQRLGQIKSTALVEALATVPRENFVGPGPWKTMRTAELAKGYQLTPDSNPRHLYENVLVALDAQRRLNNGEPLALLQFLDSLALSAGDRFLHIGCGVGYYTAIAAQVVGPQGGVVAVEIDPELAGRAKTNLRALQTVKIVADNGTLDQFGSFDAIFVNAGCTRPHSIWLDQLAVGGRALIPLTVSIAAMPGIGAGAMLLLTRGESEYRANFTSPVGIFHCEGARSTDEEDLLEKAFAGGDQQSVNRLRRDRHELGPNCWFHAADFCLESDAALRRRPRVAVAAAILENYVGRYQISPTVVLIVTRRDDWLFVQSRGAPETPIYPESHEKFFYKAADAQITFLTDETGRATDLVLRHGGHEVSAQRID